ncbi:retroviral-like aspartic protease, partial [Candidatus Falkowbacteria bacterium]|nr:retroviral-like aspartic protease [Candidatus Falkowbacteria bacterium]
MSTGSTGYFGDFEYDDFPAGKRRRFGDTCVSGGSCEPVMAFSDWALDVWGTIVLHPSVRVSLETRIGRAITCDALFGPLGARQHCVSFASSSQPPAADFAGQCTWMHVPADQLHDFVCKYRYGKQRSPYSTAAVVLVPRWEGGWRRHLQGMRLLHSFSAGERVFAAVDSVGSLHRLPGTPWPLDVYVDLPQPGTACVGAMQYSESDSFVFTARFAGQAVKVMMDSGASDVFIAQSCVRTHKFAVSAPTLTHASTADGTPVKLAGACKGQLVLGDSRTHIQAHVMPDMMQGVDIILGMTWLQKHGAVLDCANMVCTLQQPKKVRLPCVAAVRAREGPSGAEVV